MQVARLQTADERHLFLVHLDSHTTPEFEYHVRQLAKQFRSFCWVCPDMRLCCACGLAHTRACTHARCRSLLPRRLTSCLVIPRVVPLACISNICIVRWGTVVYASGTALSIIVAAMQAIGNAPRTAPLAAAVGTYTAGAVGRVGWR